MNMLSLLWLLVFLRVVLSSSGWDTNCERSFSVEFSLKNELTWI